MINLLPPDIKQNYRYARRNLRTAFWAFAFLLAIGGVAAITGSGLFVINRSIDTNKADIVRIQADLTSQDLAGTQRQVTAISTNLKLMATVLSKEILFSKLLVKLGNTTPPDVVLTSLSISQTEGGIDITARAKNYNGAAQLQANMADPANKIFSKADIVSISCANSATEGALAAYPCTITIKALFASDNPFLFINTDKVAP
jgi:Tfp pilus assembly protein PilN